MALRSRPMEPKDVRECVEIIAAHPVIGPRYGSALKDLRAAWLRLLRYEAKTSCIVEKVGESSRGIAFVGVSIFITDDFLRELKRPPLSWFGPELARRIVRGESPILSNQQLAEANASRGLNLLVWEGCYHPDFKNEMELPRFVMDLFLAHHRGFRLKELISSELESAERLEWTLNSGSKLWDPERGRYIKRVKVDFGEIVRRPHRVGLTRELELLRRPWSASWVGALFDYHLPRFGFSRSEQRLLLSALAAPGGTDQELGRALGLSLPTIKKTWLSIYRRVTDCEPDIISDNTKLDSQPERGKEKRRRLLAYVREHPEELRPISRRLLVK